MSAAPACRAIKMVWRARTLRDNLEAFELLAQRHKPTIALCMGPCGLPSRVLAKKFGALFTFAALDKTAATAPGQPTIDELKQLYRRDALNAESAVFGVIGYPVDHSMSPAVHNAGFDAISFNGIYLPMPIRPEYEHLLATLKTWLAMDDLHFRGASVTIPHKANMLRFVTEHGGQVEPLAQQIGAANTLTVRDDGSLFASNTDHAAALDAVCGSIGAGRDDLKGQCIAVIGAGGVAQAVVAGFASYGATVMIYNRTFPKAMNLAERFAQSPGKVVPKPLETLGDCRCQIFVNCTSVGMHPNTKATVIASNQEPKGWGPGAVAFDTVYNPIQTQFLQQAHAAGCVTIPGTEMFVHQAAAQFKLWTGRNAPLDTFRTILAQHLS